MAKGMSFKVLLELQAKEFQKGIKSIQKQLQGFGRFVKSAFALGSVTMFGKQVVQVSKDFEDAMARVQAVSNATTEEFKKMQAEAQKLGSTTRYTATEAASALENLTRNGMSAAQATKALSQVLAMAQANSIDLARSADIMTNTLNMFGLSVNSASKASDVLSSTASHAATDINSLYDALVNAAPAANVLGFSLEETSAAIGALAQRGVKGSEAGTKLRIAFQKMADPKVIAKMQAQGIQIDENSMKVEGLYKTVEKLANAKLSLGQLGSIFDAKSAMAVQQLIASMGDLNYMLEVTANSAGETSRMMSQSVGSVQKELDTLKSKYEGLLISIGQKTSGVVKGAIKLMQNLIGNFETVGGTIMNIASIAVPLLTKRVIALGTSLRVMFTQAAAGAVTLKVAMGDWITLIATLATWVGTALVGAWNKATKAMRDAKDNMSKVTKESEDLQITIDDLKKAIGDGSNQNSVNGALAKAIEMFPQFADAIKDAAAIAASTENGWERLKNLLQDIADLQNSVSKKEAKQQVADAAAEEMAKNFEVYTTPGTTAGFYGAIDSGGLIKLRKDLKKTGKNKEQRIEIFKELSSIILKNQEKEYNNRIDDIIKYFKSRGVIVSDSTARGLLTIADYGEVAKTPSQKVRRNWDEKNKSIQRQADLAAEEVIYNAFMAATGAFNASKDANLQRLKDKEITLAEYNKNMYEAAQKMLMQASEYIDQTDDTWKDLLRIANRYPKPETKEKPEPDGGSGKTKEAKNQIKDALDDYREGAEKLQNRLNAGTITTEEYENELKNLVNKTWETITAVSNFEAELAKLGETVLGADLQGKYNTNKSNAAGDELKSVYDKLAKYLIPTKGQRDTSGDWKKTENQIMEEKVKVQFDYAESLNRMVTDLEAAIENGEFDIVNQDAIEMLEKLREAAKKASEEADNLQTKLDLSEAITKLDEEIKSLSNTSFNTFNTVADVFDRLSSSLMSIAQVFDEDLQDSPFFKAFQAFNSVLNSSIQIMEAVMSVIELRKQLETKAAMEKVKNTAVEVAANEAATASEVKKAAASAGAAAAGGASAVASIPYVGPALAIAAVASITAAILAAMSKFEQGGIVGGNSYSGDKVLARLNSGEAVLTRSDQRTLFDILHGKKGAGLSGDVTFKLRGSDLIGAIETEQRRRSGR